MCILFHFFLSAEKYRVPTPKLTPKKNLTIYLPLEITDQFALNDLQQLTSLTRADRVPQEMI
jgi:hypothetical protein